MLKVPDAIERSCNVFFETVADKLGMVRQRYWADRFGLGRPTGIGLPEVSGHLPNPANIPAASLTMATCFAGIGQGEITVTPLQMANVAATIARDGIWMKPQLLDNGTTPDRINLGFAPADIAAVKDGMWRVLNRPAGTGNLHHDGDPDAVDALDVAGKTGTSQAEQLTIPLRDDEGNIILKDGKEQRVTADPNDPTIRTWYIAAGDDKKTFSHHWVIGYTPADHPRIAFAVFAEYGGSGTPVATSITRDLLKACIEEGYLDQKSLAPQQ
jgi:penicillin-binding protein 2